MNTLERTRFAALLIVLALAGAAGCSAPKMFSLNSTWPFGDDEPKPELPNRVAGLWTDTVLHKAGETPQRGFGGRLMFYGKEAEKPVLVEGELVVYAFDETGREPTDNKPTRRYVFPADQLALRQSESPVGPSYNFFLPWDAAGGPQTEVSIICRFQPKGGAVVVSEQTKHLLPGVLRPAGTAAVAANTPPKLPEGVPSRPALPQLSSQLSSAAATGGAQQASYQVAAASAAPNPLPANMAEGAMPISQMTTTSIPLPQDFQIPHGAAPAPINTASPAVRQILPPGQPSVPGSNAQPAVPAAGVAVPSGIPGQSAGATQQTNRFSNAYQPPARNVTPTVYNPAFASTPANPGINQPLQVPPMRTMAPPTVTPLAAPPQTQTPPQTQAQLPTATPVPPGAAVMSPQTAAKMMQVPTSGTASVTYR